MASSVLPQLTEAWERMEVDWDHLQFSCRDPSEVAAAMPTFVVGEYLFYGLSLLALVHALSHGKNHVAVWVASIVCGCMNDAIFMALPIVDNFWHAQASVMLTPRLPLYILCAYNIFMYYSTVGVWRLRLPPIREAVLTGVVAELFYCVYDIVGVRFLWWTWHDTDPPISERLLGAPIGSTMWVITFTSAFAYLLHVGLRKSVARGLALSALFSTAIMLVLMPIFQLAGTQGVPALPSLVVCLVTYAAVFLLTGKGSATDEEHPGREGTLWSDYLAAVAVAAYYGTLLFLYVTGDPAAHWSTGVHQVIGPCAVEELDVAGNIRHRYLCASDYDEPDFSFSCAAAAAEGRHEGLVSWYTVCGTAHADFSNAATALASLCLVGVLTFLFLLLSPTRSTPAKK